MSESEFWRSTPYITKLYCDAASEKDRNAYRHDLFCAFQVERFARTKRLSGEMLKKDMRLLDADVPRRQSPEDILKMVEAVNARLGGADLRDKSKDH